MARPQFMKVNGKAVCIVSKNGVRKEGAALMKKLHAERKKAQQSKGTGTALGGK